MGTERVGLRRLYDAAGCHFEHPTDETRIAAALGDSLHGELYLGLQPRFGVAHTTGADRFAIRGQPSSMGQFDYQQDASKSKYPRKFFMEVICFKRVVVEDELSDRLDQGDQDARAALVRYATDSSIELERAVGLLAGIASLRVHRQLVAALVSENYFVETKGDPVINITGPAIEILEDVGLNSQVRDYLDQIFTAVSRAGGDGLLLAANALTWLLRAWAEEDPLSTFVSLFVPLEMVLAKVDVGPQVELRKQAKAIRKILRQHGGENGPALTGFLNGLVESRRPSLNQRFEVLAQGSGMPGCEKDIQAFHHFNRIRNALVHEGDRNIRLVVPVSVDEVRALQDLVERYVNFVSFGDQAVYQTIHRSTASPLPMSYPPA